MIRTRIVPTIAVLVAVVLAGCGDDDPTSVDTVSSKPTSSYSGQSVRNYFTLLCKVTKSTPGFFPPQAARAYGYVGVAAYESVVHGIPGGQSLAGQLNGLASSALPAPDNALEYNWEIASNAAIAEMMRKMFEKRITDQNRQSIDSLEQAHLQAMSAGVDQSVIDRSIQYGKSVTAALYEFSTTDGGHESYLDPFQLPYTPPADSNCWVPTGAVTTPISPSWASCRPFLQVNVTSTQPTPPLPFSSAEGSAFYGEAKQVYDQVRGNTLDQVDIAKYWADDPFNTCTPTGHTFNILTQLLEEDRATLEKTSVGFGMLGIAENDAFIACWKSKYDYTLIRPVTYIQRYIDPTFTTVIGTPPFPAYTSGHSAEIGAGSRIFIRLFTDGSGDYPFTDFSQLQYGFPARNYTNFDEMALECADSRFYGGIHYPMDNIKGLQTGKAVGDNVFNRIQWPTNIK